MTTDLLSQYRQIREQLQNELSQLEEQIPTLIARRDELRQLFKSEENSPAENTNKPRRKELDPDSAELVRFIRDNPGVGRNAISVKFSDRFVTKEDLDNVIGKLSRAKVIENRGGNRVSRWFFIENTRSK